MIAVFAVRDAFMCASARGLPPNSFGVTPMMGGVS
jgi:hypothetical protein